MRKSKQQAMPNQNQVQTFRKQAQLDSYSYHASSSFHEQKKARHGKWKHKEVNRMTCIKSQLKQFQKSSNKSHSILTSSMASMSNFIAFGWEEGSQWKSWSQSKFNHAQRSQIYMYQLQKIITSWKQMRNERDQHQCKAQDV